jgi:tetratricopeptide (TPR) repeat protein
VTAHIAAGRARQNAGDHAAAQDQYRLAVDAARQHGDTASTLLHEALNHLGDAQRGQLRLAEAEASYRAALDHALQAYGPGRGETLVTRGRLAGVLATIGRRAEADALRKELQDALERQDPHLDGGWRAAISGVLAEQLPELGRPDLAEALLRADVEDLRRKFPRAGVTARREQKLAEVLVALDQLDEAEEVLRQARSRWALVVEGNGPTQVDAMFDIGAARLALARGDAAEALEQLSRVTLTTPADRLWLAIERSRALCASGQCAGAVQAAAAAVRELETLPQDQRPKAIEASARLALGEALAARGDLSRARTQLEQAVALRSAHDETGSRELERAARALARTKNGIATRASDMAASTAAVRTPR